MEKKIKYNQQAHEIIVKKNIMLMRGGAFVIEDGKTKMFTNQKQLDKYVRKAYQDIYNENCPLGVLSRISELLLIPYDFDEHSYAFYRTALLDNDLEGIEKLDANYNNYLVRDGLDHSKQRKKKSIHISGNGGCGKSTLAKILAMYIYKYEEDEIFKCATGNNSFDEYMGQKVVIFDEFRGNIPFRDFLDLTDPNAETKVGARYHNKPMQRAELLIFNSTKKVDELYSEVACEDPAQLYRRLDYYENIPNKFMVFKKYTYDPKNRTYDYVNFDIMNFTKLYDRYITEHPRGNFDDGDFSDVIVAKQELPF